MTATPWAELLRAGVSHLGISPRDFWQISLAEWNMLAGEGTTSALSRETLEALMTRYPDNDK